MRKRKSLPMWELVGAIAAMGTLTTVTLTALRANHFCKSLGLCSVEVIDAATAALENAEQAAMRLNKASAITDYEQCVKDLERQVRRIARDGVFTEAQRNSFKSLQKKMSIALARLEREKGDQQTVQEVRSNIGSVQRLLLLKAEKKRLQFLQRLQQISPKSFSHGEAHALRQQLQPPPAKPAQQFNPPPPEQPIHSNREPTLDWRVAPRREPTHDWRVAPRREPTLDWRGWKRPD
jgi:predicted O-linked N-acetylglucosamine transferase (SPINDLY family)